MQKKAVVLVSVLIAAFVLSACGGFESTDGGGNNTAARARNRAPVANAGPDVVIQLPTNSAQLNGSGTDSDGFITNYMWELVSGPSVPTLSAQNAANLTASGLVAGEYVFQLTVQDNGGRTASNRVSVFVNTASNIAPTVNAGADQTIALPSTSVSLNGIASDSDGTIASVQWSQTAGPAGASFSAANNLNTNFTVVAAGTYVLQLRATDNNGATAVDSVQVVVNPQPQVSLAATSGTTPEVYQGSYSVQVVGAGLLPGQNYTVNYAFINGTATNGLDYTGASGTLTFTSSTTTRTIPVTIHNDADVEGNETFTVRLSSPSSGLAIAGGVNHTVTITDTDTADPRVKCDSQVTLNWLPPTQNTDGSPLTNLAGFKIYYGPQSRTYGTMIDILGPNLTTRDVTSLGPSLYYFAMTAYNTNNDESAYSNEVRIELQQCEIVAIDMLTQKVLRYDAATGDLKDNASN